MGKGKGKFVRWVARVPANYIVLEFYGWHDFILEKFCKKINKKNNLEID